MDKNNIISFGQNTLAKLQGTQKGLEQFNNFNARGVGRNLLKHPGSIAGAGLSAMALPTMLATGITGAARSFKRAPIVNNTFIQRSSQMKDLNMGIDPFVGIKFSTRNRR